MTDEQKQQIIALRRAGAGYGRIAMQLQISINTVKSFCRRHSLVTRIDGAVCEQCGKSFISYGNKNRKYCGRECYFRHRFLAEEDQEDAVSEL